MTRLCPNTYNQARSYNYTRRTRVSPRPHPREGCLRSRASKRSLISLAPSIDNSQTNRERHETGLFALSSSMRSLFAFFSPRFLLSVSFLPPCFDSVRPHKDVPRECTLTITASHAFIAHLGGAHTIAILLAAIKYWCKNRYPKPRAVFSIVFAESPRENLGRQVSITLVNPRRDCAFQRSCYKKKDSNEPFSRMKFISNVTRIYRRGRKKNGSNAKRW